MTWDSCTSCQEPTGKLSSAARDWCLSVGSTATTVKVDYTPCTEPRQCLLLLLLLDLLLQDVLEGPDIAVMRAIQVQC